MHGWEYRRAVSFYLLAKGHLAGQGLKKIGVGAICHGISRCVLVVMFLFRSFFFLGSNLLYNSPGGPYGCYEYSAKDTETRLGMLISLLLFQGKGI